MQTKTEARGHHTIRRDPPVPAKANRPVPPAIVEPLLIQRERVVLRDLFRLIADRAEVEPSIDSDYHREAKAAQEAFDSKYQDIITRFATEKETVERELEEARKRIVKQYQTDRAAADTEFKTARQRMIRQYEGDRQGAKAEFQESRWTLTAVYEGNKSGSEKKLEDSKLHLTGTTQKIRAIDRETRDYLETIKQSGEHTRELEPTLRAEEVNDPFAQLQEQLSTAAGKLEDLKALSVPRYFKGERLVLLFIALWLVLLVPFYFVTGGSIIMWPVGSALTAILLGGIVYYWLSRVAHSQVKSAYKPLSEALANGRSLLKHCEGEASRNCQKTLTENRRTYRKELRQSTDRYRRLRAEFKQRRIDGMQKAIAKYRTRRVDIKERRVLDWSEASAKYKSTRTSIQIQFERDSHEVQEKHKRKMAAAKAAHEETWDAVVTKWRNGMSRQAGEIGEINHEVGKLFPAWSDPSWRQWTPPSAVPPTVRFGDYEVSLAQIPNGEPTHARLKNHGPGSYRLPALLSFPDGCSLLVRTRDEGRTQAVQVLQAMMFRLLCSLPPGKVRFTIIDPVGLGQNFASFMHLADHDEALVTSHIWTEMAHIEQRLADLTGHMENVIQKYLRNQFESIEEYNVHAGEVAEPYRILVVANFPSNFSSEGARRLVSIVNSGRRCGVHTLISIDTKQALPKDFNLEDLEQPGVRLDWDGREFIWQDDDFESFPLKLDSPPHEELLTRLLQMIGQRALEAKRVEVPFEFVAPAPEQWWTGDSRSCINVPLGRVGATKKQYLKLGQGTAQHVLIAGKTGSGKSTLLHALVSNLALLYSPEEVELYLVDFKKGVEFKTYAAHELPHARVIAIESEREFGLSVLQRLDVELKLRADKFRTLNAQDVRAYRDASGQPLPRILLVVDEFQEFFVEDDKLAQDCALLMDRLVRQGRAFGMHVLLGSQTLGGAYTLARSTIDQMAVRIALQCSEADAHMILSEDNSAARLLSRPGEAIYNDANGLVEGNNPFQVVWLSEERRESYLEHVHEMAVQRHLVPKTPQLVFEGNVAADQRKNSSLLEAISAPNWPTHPRSGKAWLGEAIAIKDPTLAVFRAQSGCNLLFVGQYDEAALGILGTVLVGLAAQYPVTNEGEKHGARFQVLDGTPEDSAQVDVLAQIAKVLPHPVRVGGFRELAAIMTDLAREIDRRQKENDIEAPTVFLLVNGLHRFRDLRKQEDDFSYSRGEDEKPNPAKQFSTILSEGPAVGIHTLAWCDSMNNITRSLDRQSLREFEMRVLFQMSATDSSNLIDSPLASKLGPFRAFFHSEEQGKLEKFRPYGVPSAAWLEWVKEQFAKKS